MSTAVKTTEEKLIRKRLNARLRQQRCRSRKRELAMAKKIGLAQERSAQVSQRIITSDERKSPNAQARQAMVHSQQQLQQQQGKIHFRIPYPGHSGHPPMPFRGPMHPGYTHMMPPPHMMMAMQMGRMPPMSMPVHHHYMAPPMSPGRPVTVSRSSTDESEDSPKATIGNKTIKPSPNTELAAIGGMLSLRSSSSSESDSEEDLPKKIATTSQGATKVLSTKKGSMPAKKRPVTILVPADGSIAQPEQAISAPMPWPVGFAMQNQVSV